MTLQQLRYVITIAETGSLSRAAEQLYMAQPSLTASLRELERELGVTIFTRTGRGATLTADGEEFLLYARQLYGQYESVLEKYGASGSRKKKFGVSAQHYSFAVKAFVEMVREYDMTEYEFAVRETKTMDVITDVSTMRSEIGILYLSEFNHRAMEKLFSSHNLSFTPLIDCKAYVYLWREHPLAGKKSVSMEDLRPYPCLSFEQGDGSSFYYAEEILSTADYPRTIRATDRATMLNLMVGLNGYTLCSGVISEELNGSDYIAVPFEAEDGAVGKRMEIGYLTKKNLILSDLAQHYIRELDRYLRQYQETH
jgi:DNA-binding transcriptional LysR family regulator